MISTLGVCYYPEHWDEAMWKRDAARMVETGITWVRIGEFAWSRLEKVEGIFTFEWLDRAIAVLADAGLKVVMCTPTTTPPRWMIEKHPDMLAVDKNGNLRKFGSRRHYCFSHQGYIQDCKRITRILADRYGADPRINAWQIDNEYGCHDTIISYSDVARIAFQEWLANFYGDIETLNTAWGNVFWSMEYDHFDQVDLPNLTVTEPNPAHVMAFRRFSSDQVVKFNRVQVNILRAATDVPLIHNYMGRILDFDHFEVGADLDIASWDSYPIGFLSDRLEGDDDHKAEFLQQGDPDMQAFHHDLYRAVGKGRWWVMEQQPGPVNWAPYNPAPLDGMVRLWSWEAIAHGAEVVSYFRWRQAPFAQEQMHAGLLRPDNTPASGMAEAAQVAQEIAALGPLVQTQADVALIFDYPSDWAWNTMPQGADFDYFRLVFSAYRALRRAGFSIDIIPSTRRDFDSYKLVLAPGLANTDPTLINSLYNCDALAVLGPRTATVTNELRIPPETQPVIAEIDVKIELSESFPPSHIRTVSGGGSVVHWMEKLSGTSPVLLKTENNATVLTGDDQIWYLGSWPDETLWDRLVGMAASQVGLHATALPDGLRLRTAGTIRFAFNYSAHAVSWNGKVFEACSVTAWNYETCLLE
jgi:beta-galactosidase